MCLLSLAVIAVGGALIMKGKLNTIDLITFSLYVTAFVNPLRKLSNFAELFANGTAGLHRFVEMMRTEPTLIDSPDAKEDVYKRQDEKFPLWISILVLFIDKI